MSRKKNTPPPGTIVIESTIGTDNIVEAKPGAQVITPHETLPALRVVTRRALAHGAVRGETDRADREQLLGLAFSSAHLVCTISDIGDPTFRLWMSQHVATRLAAGAKFTLEIV